MTKIQKLKNRLRLVELGFIILLIIGVITILGPAEGSLLDKISGRASVYLSYLLTLYTIFGRWIDRLEKELAETNKNSIQPCLLSVKNGGDEINMWELFDKCGVKLYNVYKVVEEWEFFADSQQLKIKIKQDREGKYSYALSHYLKTPHQADDYRPSSGPFNTKDQAISDALSSLFVFYVANEDHDDYQWIENDDY